MHSPSPSVGLLHITVALTLVLLSGTGCHKKVDQTASVATGTVTRQDVTVAVEATGVIDPRNAVQVKSKASGQIVKMPIEVGDHVTEGQLLVQIDPRQVQSQYDETAAAVNSAKQTLSVATAQRQRADQLFGQRVMTVTEHEAALTTEANAKASLASAQTNLILASIALADVTIRAPIAGTVIDKSVSAGQVISSATGNVSGGTTLLTLANLGNILDSALVNESDIGRVQPGQSASVTVDAYPNRTFQGTVERVAPQATVQQSVTMFPVLIGLNNQEGLLKPGMNSDVTVLIQQVSNALAVPNDAITSSRDAMSAAMTLGVDTSSVRQLLVSQRSGAQRSGTQSSGTKQGSGKQDSSRGSGGRRGAGMNGSAASAGGRAAHADSSGRARAGVGGSATAPRHGIVFVAQNGKFVPRLVTIGVGNYDVTQVISGVQEGEQVALLSAAMLRQARDSMLSRIRSRSSLPGMGGGGTSPGGARSGGQGGGRSGGSASGGGRAGGGAP